MNEWIHDQWMNEEWIQRDQRSAKLNQRKRKIESTINDQGIEQQLKVVPTIEWQIDAKLVRKRKIEQQLQDQVESMISASESQMKEWMINRMNNQIHLLHHHISHEVLIPNWPIQNW
jgi:predicted NodU family carbamoyl transferase